MKLKAQLSQTAKAFLKSLDVDDRGRISADITALESGFEQGLQIKVLRGKIREIISGKFRTVFFQCPPLIIVTEVFRKKTKKTPPAVIERAQKWQKELEC